MPEFHSRIHYYIGLAYNDNACGLKMPLKSIYFWRKANKLEFLTPYVGMRKTKSVKKFLDHFSHISQVMDHINLGPNPKNNTN